MKLFKDYYTTNEITTTPYGIAEQLRTVYGTEVNGIMGEVAVQAISHSTLDSFPADWNGLVQALYYLNARVEAVRKTLTVWDAYQIKGTLQNKDLVLSQLAQLPPSSSLVSNITDPFSWIDKNGNTISVHKGDVFVKDSNEEIHHVQSLSNGFYAPTAVTRVAGTNNYFIQYHYYTDTPVNEEWGPDDEDPEQPAKIMKLRLEEQATELYGYNAHGTLTANGGDITISFKQLNSRPIIPVIKLFTEDHEQIFIDDFYTKTSTTFTITNSLPINIIYEVK